MAKVRVDRVVSGTRAQLVRVSTGVRPVIVKVS